MVEKEWINKIGFKLHKNREEILQFCSAHRRIYLYGAGYVANMMYEYLRDENITIYGVVVGDGSKNDNKFKGVYDVREISDISFYEEDGIILCVRVELQNVVKETLKRHGIKDEQIYEQKIYAKYVLTEAENLTAKEIRNNNAGYFSKYLELDGLGQAWETDKCSKAHNYLNKYEFFLKRWKQEDIILLELGVFKGASLKMWGNYFEKATIYGVDIDLHCKKYEEENRNIIIGDLGDEAFLDEIGKLSPTVIIDDASHLWSHQIKSIYHLLPALKSGGIFIMEDLGTSFASYRYMNYDDASVSTYDFCSALSEVVNSGENLRKDHLMTELLPLKREIEYLASQIEMICFIKESCIMVKK